VRDDLAMTAALHALLPILVLLPLLAWLSAHVVATQLAPVSRLAQQIDAQPPDRLAPLPDDAIPAEIASFIHAINRLLERVNRLTGEQRRFIADAAHELRTPLGALLLQAQNLESAPSFEEMRGRLLPLRDGIERARRLTEQLLSLARAQAGSGAAATIDLAAFGGELIAEYASTAIARGIHLGMHGAEGVKVQATPEALRMIVGNALDNALRYTPRGGEVTLRVRAEGSDALVEVIDTGPGIPVAERERVFDAFHRREGARGEGSGLGLSIARDAAARLGGEVSLHDAPGSSGLLFRHRQPRLA
jgi:two-component system OmpR family sensor kinase